MARRGSAAMTVRFIATRVGRIVVIELALVTVVFFLTRIVTNPVDVILGARATADQRILVAERLGLDQPVVEQFWNYARQLLSGDFGNSLWLNQPSLDVVISRVPNTFVLATLGIILAAVLGISLGIIGGMRPGSPADRISIALSSVTMAIPDFWLGIVLIIVFAVQLQALPTGGYPGLGAWHYLVLPVVTVAVLPAGRLARVTRERVAEEMTKPYVLTASARGLTNGQVMRKHVLRNISASAVTLAGYDYLLAFTGAIATLEVVFGFPGIGRLAVEATLHQDIFLVSTIVILTGLIVGIGNLVLELVTFVIDRRTAE